ncbi:MAG: hypothetical protein ACRD8W_20995, partial [Nitrososphaeraceae archaeon]
GTLNLLMAILRLIVYVLPFLVNIYAPFSSRFNHLISIRKSTTPETNFLSSSKSAAIFSISS